MVLRRSVLSAVTLAVLALAIASGARSARALRCTTPRATLPPECREKLGNETLHSPSAWVFVRGGCPHCEAHLAALRRTAATLDTTRRARVLSRVHVLDGEAIGRRLRVQRFPTTWIADAGGAIRETWCGARGPRAWSRAFARLEEPAR